jgi:cytosine/adenosine deaminase-related metal-dependent hydrolase
VLKYLDAKINVCFGCDGASSNDSQDMLEVPHAHTTHDTRHTTHTRTHTHTHARWLLKFNNAQAIKMGSILHNITDFDYTRWITPDQVFPLSPAPIEGRN